MIEDEGCW